MRRAVQASRKGAVDWVELRRRVEEAGQALDPQAALAPERAREVLEARARALARPPAAPREHGGLEAIVFTVGDEVYAIESRFVFEVFRPVAVARLPGAEPPVFGVTAWRGALLRVLDLRPVLGRGAGPPGPSKLVAALGDERPAFGVVLDGIRGVLLLNAADIQPAPETPGVAREFLRGLTGDVVLVLDVPALLRRFGGAT